MASSALEEKINKIRQQNEEIRRRYEEVEEDKKNAAKSNALVQMVPSTDWPERKEPPEFSNPPKTKPKATKEKHEYIPQFHPGGEGKKVYSFAQGEGPPPDPKYNFLADSEREEHSGEYAKENSGNRSHQKATRGSFKKKTVGREAIQKDNKPNKGNYRDETQPGYDAWRAERNRIDEDRISRQRTAEGNWRREWDNDKVHIIDEGAKKVSRPTLGDFAKKDHKDSDRRYHSNNNEHTNYNRGGGRPPHRGSSKNFYGNYDNRSHNTYDQHRNNTVAAKTPVSPTAEDRTVVATEKSLKVTVNHNNSAKGQVMSVKVNSPSIAGTGRVGPRQRTRVTYSHSDADLPPLEDETFLRQESFEDKSKGAYFNNQKFSNLKRSNSQKKKENEAKYHYQKRETKKEDADGNSHKYYENEFRSYPQKDQQKPSATKSPKPARSDVKVTKNYDSPTMNVPQTLEAQQSSTSDEVQSEDSIEHHVDHNVTMENNETIQSNESNEIETSHEENGQTNVQVASEASIKPETVEILLTPDRNDPEHVAKDDRNENSSDNENECSEAVVNDVAKDLQEISNTSSEELVPNNNKFNEELVRNESNEEPNNVVNEEEAPSNKGDTQSSEENAKQFVNDDCDSIEDEAIVQRSTQEELKDNPVSSLEDQTNSVIEINNRSVCNNESVEENKAIAENQESSDKNIKDTIDKSEVKSENTHSQEKADEMSVENNIEKTMDVNVEKDEKQNEENSKPLQ